MKKLFLSTLLAFTLGCNGLHDSGENFSETGFDNIRASRKAKSEIKLIKNQYKIGEKIVIVYYKLPGNSKDWIGLYEIGADHEDYLTYQYTKGKKYGTMTFEGLDKAGKSEARLYHKDSYKMEGSVTFKV